MHKVFANIKRTFTAAAKADRVSFDFVQSRLPDLLPTATAAEIAELVDAARGEAEGAAGAEQVRLRVFEPCSKEPCADVLPPVGFRLALQRMLLRAGLALRRDVEAALGRAAATLAPAASPALAHASPAAAPASPSPPPGRSSLASHSPAPHSPARGAAAEAAREAAREAAPVRPADLRHALLSVDAAIPDLALSDIVRRVFPPADAPPASPEPGATVAPAGSLPFAVVVERLFSEPMRRYSPRADAELVGEIAHAIRGGGGAGKGKKGGKAKKGKGGDAAPAGVTVAAAAAAIASAEPERPWPECEWLAAECIDAAAAARRLDGADAAAGEATVDAFVAALEGGLVQRYRNANY